MYWLNMPETWKIINGKDDDGHDEKQLRVVVPTETDFWRHTVHQFVKDDAPFYWRFVYGDFEARLTVKGKFLYLHDMAGMMIRQNEDQWMTCGICNYQDQRFLSKNKQQLYVSCNVTRQKSDWSTHRLLLKHKTSTRPDGTKRIKSTTFHVWVRRIGELVECHYSLDNENWTLVRQAVFAPEVRRLRVGMVCLAPESAGFAVTFSNFMIRGGDKMQEDDIENLVYKTNGAEFIGMMEKDIVDRMTKKATERMRKQMLIEKKKQEKLWEKQRKLEAASQLKQQQPEPTAMEARETTGAATVQTKETISGITALKLASGSRKEDVAVRKPRSTRSFAATPIEEPKKDSSKHLQRPCHAPSSIMSLSTTSSASSSFETRNAAADPRKSDKQPPQRALAAPSSSMQPNPRAAYAATDAQKSVNQSAYNNFSTYKAVTKDSSNRQITNHYAKLPRKPPAHPPGGGRLPQSNRNPVRGGQGRGPYPGRPSLAGRRIPGPPPPGRGGRPPARKALSMGGRPGSAQIRTAGAGRCPPRRASSPGIPNEKQRETPEEQQKRIEKETGLRVADTDVPKVNPLHMMLSGRNPISNPLSKKRNSSSEKSSLSPASNQTEEPAEPDQQQIQKRNSILSVLRPNNQSTKSKAGDSKADTASASSPAYEAVDDGRNDESKQTSPAAKNEKTKKNTTGVPSQKEKKTKKEKTSKKLKESISDVDPPGLRVDGVVEKNGGEADIDGKGKKLAIKKKKKQGITITKEKTKTKSKQPVDKGEDIDNS